MIKLSNGNKVLERLAYTTCVSNEQFVKRKVRLLFSSRS